MAVQTQIQTRRGTAASWTSTNPTLAAGEIGFETDTGKFKIGNGSTAWASLAYSAGATAVTYLFNATGGQTTFSGADANGLTLAYTVGAEQVYLNGVLQVRGSDYTATNGTSIVLTSGALVSDVLNVIAFSAMTITDTYTQAQANALFIPDAIVDAKGDLIAATAADTVARLAVGTNGQTLVADSTAATGLKWAPSPNFVGCSLWKSAAQSLSNATATFVTFDTEVFDTDGFHSTSTNTSRITIPAGLGGKYQVNGTIVFASNSNGARFLNFTKNNSLFLQGQGLLPNASFDTPLTASFIIEANAGDYLEMTVYQNSGVTLNAIGNGLIAATQFSVQYLGA
jgi:hypothetical protein